MNPSRFLPIRRLSGALAFLALISVRLLAGSACCSGSGDFGLEGSWTGPGDAKGPKTVTFTHASYESSRPLFAELNADFAKRWAKKTGFKLTVSETHGGTEAQERAIQKGAEPDIISLDNPGAIDELARTSTLLPASWKSRLPDNSAPFTTTVVFVVAKGNPRHIRDWNDLVADGVKIITPDPRTSGRGQWNYLAAWGYARRARGSDDAARAFVARLYERVSVLNSSARGAADTFVRRGEGDVLLVWESEARDLLAAGGGRALEIVTPPASILVEPPVAWIDTHVAKHENARVSISFAKYLYSPEAQEIIARYHYRPRLPEVAAKAKLPPVQLFTVDEQFGGWSSAAEQHFAKGRLVEQILRTADAAPVATSSVAAR